MRLLHETEFGDLMFPDISWDDDKVLQALRQYPGLVTACSCTGTTLLIEAACEGSRILVVELLKKGADINAQEDEGRDALMWACKIYTADIEMVILLLDSGANLFAIDKYSASALHHAARRGYMDICLLLLSRGANLMATDSGNLTPLEVLELETYNRQTCRRFSVQEQEARRRLLRAAFEEGPNISQKRRRAWERRNNAMMVMAGCGLQPLKARRELELDEWKLIIQTNKMSQA